MLNFNDLRKEYELKSLDLSHLNRDPFLQFFIWFEEAKNNLAAEHNAMALATASLEGRPSCRMVLIKEVDGRGFSFFTNYESRKGRDLTDNPVACGTFYWALLERQVRIEGKIEKLTRKESENYFASRPRNTQLGTWASHQDQVLHSREELEKAYRHYEEIYHGSAIPTPPYWGGYRLLPSTFEFWQGRANRLHDRFRYTLHDDEWLIERLAP